jgi:hypothetical protein|tara:strand:- start:753 stop:869 length:117 start_codon:yes stop_codon:yes gene_type:complete
MLLRNKILRIVPTDIEEMYGPLIKNTLVAADGVITFFG